MLDLHDRTLYLNALRPPSGFVLDQAVATTYSLNLLTLLTVPLSFAKFELKNKDEIINDPVTLLEALRRSSGRFHIFCQNGNIKVPSAPNSLFNYLEKMIIEVSPPYKYGVFHPKLWVLRFLGENRKNVFYRFLCLSRNITFDQSWDTILTLEGPVKRSLFARNKPLSDFIKNLPELAKRKLAKALNDKISDIAKEIRHVDFKLPPFYEELKFWPMGINKESQFPIRDDYSRMLIVSPFLTNDILKRLGNNRSGNILISRKEEMDALEKETLDRFEEKYQMDEAAYDKEEAQIEISSEAAKRSQIDEESELTGLHAKILLAESGRDAYLWTGSANATNAAFDNHNVEFLVELKGKRSKVGIDRFLEKEDHVTSFRDLLEEYIPIERPEKESERRKELKRQLDIVQREISNSSIRVKVMKDRSGRKYDMELIFPKYLKFPKGLSISGRVWPISVKYTYAQPLQFDNSLPSQYFKNLSLEQITGLFAFELKMKSLSETIQFVLNLPVTGMPENRDEKILQVIISDKKNFIRYLLLLLFEGEYSYLASNIDKKIRTIGKDWGRWFFWEDMPLFEELVRAYSRFPEKINRISHLIKQLKKTEEGRKLLPEEFETIWSLFEEADLK
ncbi:MAG: phospholipase D family protein [Candidatus Aminicenantaceae bacterium]